MQQHIITPHSGAQPLVSSQTLCYHALALSACTQQVFHNTVSSDSSPPLHAVTRRELALSDETSPFLSDVVIAGNDSAPTPCANIGRTFSVAMVFGAYPYDWAHTRCDTQPELFLVDMLLEIAGSFDHFLAKVLRQ